MKCKHPPNKLFCGTFYDIFTFVDCYWVGCTKCGKLLKKRIPFKSPIPILKKEIECLIKLRKNNISLEELHKGYIRGIKKME